MPKLPSVSGERVVKALKRAGFVQLRQKGSHVSLEKRIGDKKLRRARSRTSSNNAALRLPNSWNFCNAAPAPAKSSSAETCAGL